jgi:L-ribulose-5-phosphate 3-epimerase UlaE
VRLLQDYLDRIEASMAKGDEILSQRDPAKGDRVKAMCTEAALLIGSYHLFVHREIFEPMMTSGDDRVRKQVCILKAECISLTEDLRVGVKALAAHDVILDYDAVHAGVEGFNGRVRRHIVAIKQLLASPDGSLLLAA